MSADRSRRATACSLFVLAALGFVSPAQGQPTKARTWRLEYTRSSGTERCPDKKELEASVASRIGYDPFDPAAPRTISVSVVTTPERMEAHIEAKDESGQIVGTPKAWASLSRCDQLIENAAVFIVDIVDPLNVPQSVVSPPETSTAATSPPPPPPSPSFHANLPAVGPPAHREPHSPPAKSRVQPPQIPQLMLSLGAGASVGTAPGIAPSFSLGAGLRWSLFSLSFEGRYDLPGRDETRAASQLGGALLPCIFPRLGTRVALEACVSGQVARIWLSSTGTNEARYSDVAIGVGVRGGVEVQLGRLRARLGVDAIHYDRPAIIRVDGVELWRMSPLTIAVRAGLVGVFDVF